MSEAAIPQRSNMQIVCIGAGYVGGPTMAMIALKCPDITVTVVDICQERIDAWNSPAPATADAPNQLPIFEPGLAEVIFEVRGRNLFFTDDTSVIKKADIIFISVNTPTKIRGIGAGRSSDLSYIESCARMIGTLATEKDRVVVVEKSTVPVHCSTSVKRVLAAFKTERTRFSILSNPEFLAEGTAMSDLADPDRVLIGGEDEDAVEILAAVYRNWVPRDRILTVNLWSSELSKLVANAFLAQRISSINSITPLCEVSGADVSEVRNAISRDKRIGQYFLNPSVGFGGSCFQKDILNLVYICETNGLKETAEYWEQVVKMNEYQKRRFYERIVGCCFGSVRNKSITIFGYAFKRNTGDTRESPAISLCSRLLVEGARLSVYDPQVCAEAIYSTIEYFITQDRLDIGLDWNHTGGDQLAEFVRSHVKVLKDPMEAARGANAVVVLTEWEEFRLLDYRQVYDGMVKPAFLFDGRLLLDHEKMEQIGFEVFSIGKASNSSFF